MGNEASLRATPAEVEIHTEPRQPVTDPTLGIQVDAGARRSKRTAPSGHHRGFADARLHERGDYRTDISWPAIVAYELGLRPEEFRFPIVRVPIRSGRAAARPGTPGAGLGGQVRRATGLVGDHAGRPVGPVLHGRHRGLLGDGARGRRRRPTGEPFHNMAVYGWDVLDAQLLTSTIVASGSPSPETIRSRQVVEHNADRAGLVVLQEARALGAVAPAAADDGRASRWWRRDAGRDAGRQQRVGVGRRAGALLGPARSTRRSHPTQRLAAKGRASTCGGPPISPPTGRCW